MRGRCLRVHVAEELVLGLLDGRVHGFHVWRLAELAELFDPPLKKSGLNHRLAKLSEIAEEIRKER